MVLTRAELHDEALAWPVITSRELAHGRITTYLQEDVRAPDGSEVTREYLRHPGAVGILALDAEQRVALVRQYRHPVRHRLVEPPAGLLDVDGEDFLMSAQRELAEEVGLAANDWRVLVDVFTSPGMASETLRVYLARDLFPADAPEGFLREGEEAEMDAVWAPLNDVVDAVLGGDLQNPTVVAGALSAYAALARGGFETLRPADAPWPARSAADRR